MEEKVTKIGKLILDADAVHYLTEMQSEADTYINWILKMNDYMVGIAYERQYLGREDPIDALLYLKEIRKLYTLLKKSKAENE